MQVIPPILGNMEIVFSVTQDGDGGYVAECLSHDIYTQGNSGKICGPTRGKQSRPSFSTRLIRPRFASTLSATKFWRWRELPRDLSGAELINLLGKHYGYRKVNQEGSHVILETTALANTGSRSPIIRRSESER